MAIYSQPPEAARPACPRCGTGLEALYTRNWMRSVPPYWACFRCSVAFRRGDLLAVNPQEARRD